jgi:mRNA interferase MazF
MSIDFKKFEIVSVKWGNSINLLEIDKLYSIQDINYFYGINIGVEFSNVFSNREIIHMGIILSNNFLNEYSKSVLVAPITSLTEKHKEAHKNKVILYKNDFSFLENDSVIILNKIRELDKTRILKHIAYIDKSDIRNKINDRLKFTFSLK